MQMTVPEANPRLYISIVLALTFPFNIIIGIPIYQGVLSITSCPSPIFNFNDLLATSSTKLAN